jgi:DNA-binding NtrC family response regulator
MGNQMGRTKTILFADPKDPLAGELERFMAERGYDAVPVRSLKETLLTLQSRHADVLVLNASLLEEDCELISVIKNMERNLPIIVCAETNTPELESRIRQQRIFYYHIKSFGVQDLEMAISNAVNGLPE